MKTFKFFAILMAAGLIFTGCSKKHHANQSANIRPIQDIVWQLVELDGTKIEADGQYEVTFLNSGRLAGIGDCNRFFGSFEITNAHGGIKISPAGSTMMACPNLELEGQFFKMFESVRLYQFDGDYLYLFSDNNKARAIFIATNKPVRE